MTRVYCTEEEYRGYVGQTDAEVSPRDAARASRAVDLYLRSAVYRTDAGGYPTDPEIRELLRSAAAEQLAAILADREHRTKAEAASPLGRPLSSASIDGVSWSADTGASAGDAALSLSAGPETLCPSACAILATLPRAVIAYG